MSLKSESLPPQPFFLFPIIDISLPGCYSVFQGVFFLANTMCRTLGYNGVCDRYIMTSCSSDYKMFIYFNLLDTDKNWYPKFALNIVQLCLICDRKHF